MAKRRRRPPRSKRKSQLDTNTFIYACGRGKTDFNLGKARYYCMYVKRCRDLLKILRVRAA